MENLPPEIKPRLRGAPRGNRNAARVGPTVAKTYRLPRDVVAWLGRQPNATAALTALVRAAG
ncbi:MAG: hypothetical protein H7343_12220 [Undibacterium sp.]|nr:hypothetical protein [Opitutaceae bacterium]